MSKKKHKNKPVIQKIREDPIWRKRTEMLIQRNLILGYYLETMLKELERIYKGVIPWI